MISMLLLYVNYDQREVSDKGQMKDTIPYTRVNKRMAYLIAMPTFSSSIAYALN